MEHSNRLSIEEVFFSEATLSWELKIVLKDAYAYTSFIHHHELSLDLSDFVSCRYISWLKTTNTIKSVGSNTKANLFSFSRFDSNSYAGTIIHGSMTKDRKKPKKIKNAKHTNNANLQLFRTVI